MASSQTTKLLTTLQNSGIQTEDPSLYNVLKSMIVTIDGLADDLKNQIVTILTGGGGVVPDDVVGFKASFTNRNVILSWNAQAAGISYEIRKGSVWATADYVTSTIANSVPLDPQLVGSYTYLIKAIGATGVYSISESTVTFSVPAIGPIVLTALNLSNNILFDWDEPSTTFDIDYYLITKNGVNLGIIDASFFVYTELVAGVYTYTVQAVDIAGNISAITSGSTLVLTLTAPSDFVLTGSMSDDLFDGVKTKCFTETDPYRLLAPIFATRTFQQHFTDNAWTTPQQQVNAGYPIYIQPSEATATYVKKFDFGASTSNTLVSVIYSTNPISAAVALAFIISWSNDDIIYTNLPAGTSGFVNSAFRYVKVTITFTPTLGTSLIELTNLTVNLNVQTVMDGGSVTANAGDVGGTTVNMNRVFLAAPRITFTSDSPQPIYPVFQTVTTTTFKVLIFDSSGNRITKDIHWHARGIIQ